MNGVGMGLGGYEGKMERGGVKLGGGGGDTGGVERRWNKVKGRWEGWRGGRGCKECMEGRCRVERVMYKIKTFLLLII